MFEAVEYLGVIAVAAIIFFWYLRNARAPSDGALGPLALRRDAANEGEIKEGKPQDAQPTGEPKPTYRTKPRAIDNAKDDHDGERAKTRRKFRQQDEARYRVKDKKPPTKP